MLHSRRLLENQDVLLDDDLGSPNIQGSIRGTEERKKLEQVLRKDSFMEALKAKKSGNRYNPA